MKSLSLSLLAGRTVDYMYDFMTTRADLSNAGDYDLPAWDNKD